jgi:NADPH:quinone reductase-like Zn-dependent oxidoreductase
MKAAQINGYGGQDVMKTVDNAPKPTAGAGQVLVEVHAAAANPFDYKVREGYMKEFIPLQLPATLGGDVAGTVAEIGGDVTGFTVGQAVYGMANAAGGQGSFAEFTPVSAQQLAAKPKSVDFVAAAALPLAAVSAYQALVDHIGLQAGQKILIHGGAGGIGSLAIQIAKNLGAYVAATVNAGDTDFVKSLGADEVIDYQTQDFSALLKDYDAVFDTVGGETNTKSYAILKKGGALVSMVQPAAEALAKQYDVKYTQQSSKATVERLAKIAELVDSSKLKAEVDKVFPLDQAAEALEYLKTGHPRGKVVIQVKNI